MSIGLTVESLNDIIIKNKQEVFLMANIFTSVEQLIGRTPLLELQHIYQEEALQARVLAKLESFNPGGSAKDRVALSMLDEAEKSGKLCSGGTIIEPTSGNTGIGLACLAAARGYRAIIVMPDTASVERQKLIAAYGAQLVLTDGKLGMLGATEKALELNRQIPGSMIAGQFDNPANPNAHYSTTGPEIYADTDGQIDIFVAGVGTGGTITGVGRYLKEQNPNIHIAAVEPASSPLLSAGYAGSHGLQGIGANFVPSVLDTKIYDEIITVTEEQAFEAARLLASKEGILAGISSGAALHAALCLARDPANRGKTIVVLLTDTGERYLSTALFA